jgi:hypothetical protein
VFRNDLIEQAMYDDEAVPSASEPRSDQKGEDQRVGAPTYN